MDLLALSGEFLPIGIDGKRTIYVTGCSICGKQIKTKSWNHSRAFKCDTCKVSEKENSEMQILKNELNRLTKIKRLDDTKRLIIKQGHSIEKYEKAIQIISKYLDRKNWFQSIPEMITALELVRSKIRFNAQVKVGRFRVDFVLPDQKVALEVDSFYHHLNTEREDRDEDKDALVLNALGVGWECIHIEGKLVTSNIQGLVPELKRVKDKLKSLRDSNNGQLPKYYRYR